MQGLAFDKLKFGSPLHDKVLNAVRDRFRMSQQKMSEYHTAWENAEALYRLYVKRTDEDALRKSKRDDDGSPQYVTITIPYSYAMAMAAHTYWHSVFLSRSPLIQLTGRHGESQLQVQAFEALLDYQVFVGGMVVPLDLWGFDMFKYGLGIVGNYWAEEEEIVASIEEVPVTFLGMQIPGKTKKERVVKRIKGYQGNKVFNVRPHDFFPDPRVPLVNLNDGEFCGRITQKGWNYLVGAGQDGKYFNLKELGEARATGSVDRTVFSDKMISPAGKDSLFGFGGKSEHYPVELAEMIIELVPKEWEAGGQALGTTSYPEKWAFTIGDGSVVIGAQPLGAYHNKYGYFLQMYEMEAHGHCGRGVFELTEELNKTMSWLFNTHFYNVRKSLNDQWIVDPSRVNMKDLMDGGPGKLVRLRAEAYGTDVRTVVTQFPVQDVTAGHLQMAQIVAELMQRATGANDSIMGMLSPRGRKTAAEVRTSTSFGVNRMKTVSEYNSALGWSPLAQVMIQNTQQHYDLEQMFRIAGDLMQPGMRFIQVTPELITGFYDFVPVDGTLPIDRMAQATLWKEILQAAPTMPAIAMQYDWAAIFGWMAQIAGLKNISQFKIQVQPNNMVMDQVAAGKLNAVGPGATPAAGGQTMGDMMGQNPQGVNGVGA